MTPAQPMDGILGVMPTPNFECSNGHRFFVDGDELERCPRARCAGTLRRVGIGRRSAGTRATTCSGQDDAAASHRSGTASTDGRPFKQWRKP